MTGRNYMPSLHRHELETWTRMRGLRLEGTTSQSVRLTGVKLYRVLGQVENKTFSTENILSYIPACI